MNRDTRFFLELLQDLRHELKVPLTVIAAGIDYADREINAGEAGLAKASNALRAIRAETQRLGRMIDNMACLSVLDGMGENRKRTDFAALLRQNTEQVPETVTKGKLTLKLIPRTAFAGSEDLLLTPKDFTLLLYFVRNEGIALDAKTIYEAVWGRPMADDSRALGNAVSRLRKKLRNSGYGITSLYGSGYRFEQE